MGEGRGEHETGGHEGRAERDGERGEGEPDSVREQSAECCLEHLTHRPIELRRAALDAPAGSPSARIRSSTSPGVGLSSVPTIWPSARKITCPEEEGATGSCVTMPTVSPNSAAHLPIRPS